MKFVCEFVGGSRRGRMSLEEAEKMTTRRSRDFSEERANGACVPRAELDNKPMFEGYAGPMWDGIREDGTVVLRYETWKVYEQMSM